MKKAVITFSIIALIAGTAMQAQSQYTDTRGNMQARSQDDDTRGKMSFGVRAGLNISNVWDANGEDFVADPKTGYVGGLFLSVPLGRVVGFQPELLYSQKGLKGAGTILGTPYSFTKTTSFIDVPLQLMVKPTSFLTFVAGPQFSFLIKEKNVYTFGANAVEQEEEFATDNIRKNILGFGVGFDFTITRFLLSGRLGWDLQDNHGDGTSSTPRYKNQWAQVTFGFKL